MNNNINIDNNIYNKSVKYINQELLLKLSEAENELNQLKISFKKNIDYLYILSNNNNNYNNIDNIIDRLNDILLYDNNIYIYDDIYEKDDDYKELSDTNKRLTYALEKSSVRGLQYREELDLLKYNIKNLNEQLLLYKYILYDINRELLINPIKDDIKEQKIIIIKSIQDLNIQLKKLKLFNMPICNNIEKQLKKDIIDYKNKINILNNELDDNKQIINEFKNNLEIERKSNKKLLKLLQTQVQYKDSNDICNESEWKLPINQSDSQLNTARSIKSETSVHFQDRLLKIEENMAALMAMYDEEDITKTIKSIQSVVEDDDDDNMYNDENIGLDINQNNIDNDENLMSFRRCLNQADVSIESLKSAQDQISKMSKMLNYSTMRSGTFSDDRMRSGIFGENRRNSENIAIRSKDSKIYDEISDDGLGGGGYF
eukprot:GHVL01022316.1.p1 GENE.GHVL01022316.1~~GHVL01022316.1.p1  ORF type:complete len:464 (+),score=208.72 GHVL01022316.1:104-1393(+)